LEHFISERFEERISAKLGHPKFDPHGHCIPTIDGRMPKQASKPLTSLEQDGSFVVDSVADQDAILLKRLKAHGISPGTRIQVTKRSPQELSLLAGRPLRVLRLSRALADAVRVRSAE
ncbi:MAG: metal-dependent transcriptional regulator, partial [Terracidiphilus sp.]